MGTISSVTGRATVNHLDPVPGPTVVIDVVVATEAGFYVAKFFEFCDGATIFAIGANRFFKDTLCDFFCQTVSYCSKGM